MLSMIFKAGYDPSRYFSSAFESSKPSVFDQRPQVNIKLNLKPPSAAPAGDMANTEKNVDYMRKNNLNDKVPDPYYASANS